MASWTHRCDFRRVPRFNRLSNYRGDVECWEVETGGLPFREIVILRFRADYRIL